MLFELNIFVFLLTPAVAPSQTGPGKFLMVSWSLLFLVVLMIINWQHWRQWFEQKRDLWIMVGSIVVLLLALGAAVLVNTVALQSTGINQWLRGALDPREAAFLEDELSGEHARAYWAELSQVSARWMPYVYWRTEHLDGEYINVDVEGIRASANFVEPGPGVPDIYFFGGSTMWGDGSRDEYTIPSQVSRLLNNSSSPAYITNLAEYAYVSTQDLILFELQLAQDRVPDVAVFYQGFNDIAGAQIDGMAGLPHNEINRLREFKLGDWLRNGRIALMQPAISLEDVDFSLVANPDMTAEDVVSRYLENVRITQAVADAYGLIPIFVWQPTILFKINLSPIEAEYEGQLRNSTLGEMYLAVEDELRARLATENGSNIIVISDLFADEQSSVFIDRVHVTEAGNQIIAAAITPYIHEALDR